MKRLSGAILLIFTVAIATVWMSFPSGISTARDTSDQRISDLETRVARLEGTIYASATPIASPAAPRADTDTATIEGSGTNVSKSFELPAGVYRIELTYTIAASSDYVGVTMVTSDGKSKLIFNAADKPGVHTASTVLNAGADTFVLQVQAASDTTWKVTFSPL